MSAEIHRVRARYAASADAACRQSSIDALAEFGEEITVTVLGARAKEAMAAWPGEREWNWDDILRAYRGPKMLAFAIWHGENLCAVGLVTVGEGSVTLKYVEGALPACPLTGVRTEIALQVAACYAAACGRATLRIEPIRPTLMDRCQTEWGFIPDPTAKGYFRKDV